MMYTLIFLPLDNISLAVIHKKLPEQIEQSLFKPYMSEDGNQVRFAIRVIESDPTLRRNELLKQIRSGTPLGSASTSEDVSQKVRSKLREKHSS